jgi:exonuclease VII small subunit
MFRLFQIGFLSFLFISANTLAVDCVKPSTPVIPNGTTASLEEMIAAQTAIKTYQTGMENYRTCHEANMDALKTAASEGENAAVASYEGSRKAFNDSVSQEEKVAAEFNDAIKAYKAANPSE